MDKCFLAVRRGILGSKLSVYLIKEEAKQALDLHSFYWTVNWCKIDETRSFMEFHFAFYHGYYLK